MTEHRVRSPDRARALIIGLVSRYGMGYREIAALPYFSQFPAGSLCSFAKHGYMTEEMRRRWKRKSPPEYCHFPLSDMDAGSRKLIDRLAPEAVQRLIDNLIIDSRRPKCLEEKK